MMETKHFEALESFYRLKNIKKPALNNTEITEYFGSVCANVNTQVCVSHLGSVCANFGYALN